MGVVYIVHNKVNDKVYIGKTMRTLRQRKKEHKRTASTGSYTPFHRALIKYGLRMFRWRVLFTSEDEKALNVAEKEFIKINDSKVPNGYNLTNGGEGVVGMACSDSIKKQLRTISNDLWKDPAYRAKHKRAMQKWADSLSKEDRKKFSKAGKMNKGISKPDGFGEKVRERMNGTVSNFKGKKHSESAKVKISHTHKGIPKSDSHKSKLSTINKGKKHSEITKEKNRVICTEQWKNPEYRYKQKLAKRKE